ncbi:uncharacterized protein SPAPADRAFT_61448, partial [Spathaspora passalidarum NRRL Y-27907]
MKEQKISRSHLYDDSQSEYESETESLGYSAPNLDFEFIEVDTSEPQEVEENESKVEKQEEEEFEFPLFSMGGGGGGGSSTDGKAADEPKQPMKVSLKEAEEEVINQERPESYYIAKYTPDQSRQFEVCALDAKSIIEPVYPSDDPRPWKCIDLNKYNAQIELVKNKEKRKSRPGKKKRETKIACRERRIERVQLAKKLQVEQKKL